MNRLALVLVLFGAMGCAVWVTPAGAFDMKSENPINQDGTERFTDPDESTHAGAVAGRAGCPGLPRNGKSTDA